MVAGIAQKSKKKRKVFAGISADARALGVNRSHLWPVLIGQRHSRSLMLRFDALKAGQSKVATAAERAGANCKSRQGKGQKP